MTDPAARSLPRQGERQVGPKFVAATRHTEYVCPECGQVACGTPSLGHEHGVIHRLPVEYVGVDAVKAHLAEMELHDDLPDSFDLGYMQAWREIKEWVDGC